MSFENRRAIRTPPSYLQLETISRSLSPAQSYAKANIYEISRAVEDGTRGGSPSGALGGRGGLLELHPQVFQWRASEVTFFESRVGKGRRAVYNGHSNRPRTCARPCNYSLIRYHNISLHKVPCGIMADRHRRTLTTKKKTLRRWVMICACPPRKSDSAPSRDTSLRSEADLHYSPPDTNI